MFCQAAILHDIMLHPSDMDIHSPRYMYLCILDSKRKLYTTGYTTKECNPTPAHFQISYARQMRTHNYSKNAKNAKKLHVSASTSAITTILQPSHTPTPCKVYICSRPSPIPNPHPNREGGFFLECRHQQYGKSDAIRKNKSQQTSSKEKKIRTRKTR